MRLAKGTARHDEGRVVPANVGSHQFIICCAQFGRELSSDNGLGTGEWATVIGLTSSADSQL
jgi:hypothetical protein